MSETSEQKKCWAGMSEGAMFTGGIVAITGLMAIIITLSSLFHSVLRRLGQPSILSHILAGIVAGETVVGRVMNLRKVGIGNVGFALGTTIFYGRVLFMFFVGLQMDLQYLRHILRRSLVLAYGGSFACVVLGGMAGPFFYGVVHARSQVRIDADKVFAATGLLMLIQMSTASPVLIRIVNELKLTGSETGQLAIGAALANDITCFLAIALTPLTLASPAAQVGVGAAGPFETMGKNHRKRPGSWIVTSICMAITLAVVVQMAKTLNKRKRGRQFISKYESVIMLVLVVGLSIFVHASGYSAAMAGFLLGLVVPREGPTARTLMDWLAYPVHQLIVPVCFGALGARLDIAEIGAQSVVGVTVGVALVVLLSIGGKVAGTIVAGWLLNISVRESVVLAFLLNVKGYSDILLIHIGHVNGLWGETAQVVLLLSAIINTFMAGPASAAIVRQQRRAFQYRSHCLQDLRLDDELRVLACVHNPCGVAAMLTLAELSRGSSEAPPAVYLLHLVEIMGFRKYAITHLYHQRTDAENVADELGYGGHIYDVQQVGAAATAFTYDIGVPVRHMTAVSHVLSMDADVRNGVEDARASLVLIPFHMEQRYDGRMVCRREGRRVLNQRVLQKAPCTVGILVDRAIVSTVAPPVRASAAITSAADEEEPTAVYHVAAVFLGGPDDREVVAYATRLSAHPSVRVVVARFRPKQSLDGNSRSRSLRSSKFGSDLVMTVCEEDEASVADEEFMTDFYNRFVVPGQVSYMERYVSNGPETVAALSSMMGMFSLFIVGRGGGAASSSVTAGMGDWEQECPELGPIGDLLASDDFMEIGSVLVLQQHSMHHKLKGRSEDLDGAVDVPR